MPQFKTIFGPLVFVLTFSIANGWAQELQDNAGAAAKPGLSGESVFIPLSSRDPSALQPGSGYDGGVQSYSPPATSGISSEVAETQDPTPASNRFWSPPPEFLDESSTSNGGERWSSTPPSNVDWGSVAVSKPPMAQKNDPRFDYSEPDPKPNSLNIYEDPQEYKKQLSNGSRGYESNRWQDGGYKKPGAGSSVWGGEPITKPNTKKYDQFDYSDDDYELPQQKRSKNNFYNTLEPPPQGTYGNQWR
jgi:hypothetical protein